MADAGVKLGFVLGFLVSGLVGYSLQQARAARRRMEAPNFPMAVYTDRTPAEVVSGSQGACVGVVFWFVIAFTALSAAFLLLVR